jgi:hypothetical protein
MKPFKGSFSSFGFKTGASQNCMLQFRKHLFSQIWMQFGMAGFETGATEWALSLNDILDSGCCGFSKCTFYWIINLWRESGDVIHPSRSLQANARSPLIPWLQWCPILAEPWLFPYYKSVSQVLCMQQSFTLPFSLCSSTVLPALPCAGIRPSLFQVSLSQTYSYLLHATLFPHQIYCLSWRPLLAIYSYSSSLWAGTLSPAMLTGPQQLNGGILLAPDPLSPFFPPHGHSPSTLYPYMRQLIQPMPLTHHQALYPHRHFPCAYQAFQSLPHITSHKRQQHHRMILWRRKGWVYACLPFIYCTV